MTTHMIALTEKRISQAYELVGRVLKERGQYYDPRCLILNSFNQAAKYGGVTIEDVFHSMMGVKLTRLEQGLKEEKAVRMTVDHWVDLAGYALLANPKYRKDKDSEFRAKVERLYKDYYLCLYVRQFGLPELKSHNLLKDLRNLVQKISDTLSTASLLEEEIADKTCFLAIIGLSLTLWYAEQHERF